MEVDGLMRDLVKFFKTTRHLWGRCPHCDVPFRLADARISSSPEPPRDWLRQLGRLQASLEEKEARLSEWSGSLGEREDDLNGLERELRQKTKYLERDARSRAKAMLKGDPAHRAIVRDANRAAIMKSRSVLLGKLLECIAPCFRRFGHDPRDMRAMFDPVDYVLFDGLTVDRSVEAVTFIEVKCGTSRLSPAQKSIREAVERKRVRWEQWEIGDPRIPIVRQLGQANRKGLSPATDL